ncbi:MAG: Coenzyme F420 hydrogenase/dehydrogenase, beta subunit C-terminal domain [Thermovirgaceae bacterium]
MLTLSDVIQNRLCCSCGACSAACPTGAVDFVETTGGNIQPHIDHEKCISCGRCVSVCPGARLAGEVLRNMPEDIFSGNVLGSYVGKAGYREIHEGGQGGGVVTALLRHAFENDMIDSATAVSMGWGAPPRPQPRLITDVEELYLAQGSKYAPVPLLSVLKDNAEKGHRIAFAGLPCQVQGLRNLASVVPAFQEKIVITIGLFCDRTLTAAAIDFLITEAGLTKDDRCRLSFRDKSCGGFPGNVSIRTEDGRTRVLEAKKRMEIKDLFTPPRCRICFDKMNVFCDLAVGDPWGVREYDRNQGESVIVTRTKKGENFLDSAMASGSILAREASCYSILKGQRIHEKRRVCTNYLAAWRDLGYHLPDYAKKIMDIPASSSGNFRRSLLRSVRLDDLASRRELLEEAAKETRFVKIKSSLQFPLKILRGMISFAAAFFNGKKE